MKKIILFLVAVFAGLSLIAVPAHAQSESFFIEAELPASGTATFAVSRVIPGSPETFIPQAPGFDALDFGLLTLDAVNGIFLPTYFWVVDVGADGAGSPDVAFSYTDTANPNGAVNDGTGLGARGTIAYSEVVTGPGGQTVNLIRGEALRQANTSGGINENDYSDGFLRFSVGIATGDPLLQEGNATPFTALDNPGNYTGTLTVTATFD